MRQTFLVLQKGNGEQQQKTHRLLIGGGWESGITSYRDDVKFL